MKFHINHKYIKRDVAPDEIFLDSKNLPCFNTQQFEGRLEKAIPKRSIFFLGLFFFACTCMFIYKLGYLQVIKGEAYFKKSENNTLMKQPIFADRGLIYDRNDVLLAWNNWNKEDLNKLSSPTRSYFSDPGFSLLLGYVSSPAKDSQGNYWQDTFIGKDGVEKSYNKDLTGVNGVRITETDVKGVVQSENVVTPPVAGQNNKLSIDSRIQKKMYDSIVSMAQNASFSGGAGVLMDIKTGEVLSMTSYPEYNSNTISKGEDKTAISGYFTDKRKVFLNRPVSGLYAPGSIVKPFLGYGALAENVISPFKQILANGSISIPNPYFPDKKTIFKDHGSFGYVDMKKAIAISSDVYFYEIGGGFESQKGLGILNIDKYAKLFGIADKTNMARAVSGIASMGNIPTPHLKFGDKITESKIKTFPVDKDSMKVIQDGMRMAVTEGTATALNLPLVKVAAKSGTAQVGLGNTNTNSWIVGFFPYDNPKYSFAILMERGPKAASGNATKVMSEVVDYMSVYTPEYFK